MYENFAFYLFLLNDTVTFLTKPPKTFVPRCAFGFPFDVIAELVEMLFSFQEHFLNEGRFINESKERTL